MYQVIYVNDGGPETEYVDGPFPELWVRRGPLALTSPYDEAQKVVADADPEAYFTSHAKDAHWDARAAAFQAQASVDSMDETVCGLYEAFLSGGE